MPIPTDIPQGTNGTAVNPTNWNVLVDTINGNRDYYSKEVVFDVTHEDYGATGDGSTDDRTAINAAHTAATANGGVLYFPGGSANNTYRLSSNITFNSDVTLVFAAGAKLSIDNTFTVTISAKISPTMHQIFSGAGTIVIEAGAVEFLIPQWWGAVGDGVADDTAAIQAALTAAELKTRIVHLPQGTYLTSSQLSMRYATKLIGAGRESTTIAVGEADGSGILVTKVVDALAYEGSILSDFRIYSLTTPVAGIGIDVTGDRDILIERIWIGGWYSGALNTNKYGFDKGIQLRDIPLFYGTVRLCELMRNTYGVYITSAANECRVENNHILYGDYGVYITSGIQNAIIANNSIELFVLRGVYTEGIETIIKDNRFESSGIQPIELGAGALKCRIVGTHSVSGFSDNDSVLDNSGNDNTHRKNNSQISIAHNNIDNQHPSGVIKSQFYNFNHTEMVIEALAGDLLIRSAYEDNISVQSSLGVDRSTFNTPILGVGDYANNIQRFSDDFDNWGSSGDILTRTGNAAVAPDGTTTAGRVVSNSDSGIIFNTTNSPDFVQGDLLQISVWLRSEVAHNGKLFFQIDGVTRISDVVVPIDTRWRRYVMNIAAPISPGTNMAFQVAPGADTPTYVWGAQIAKGTPVTGTDDSGVNNKTTKLVDTGTDFRASGIDIGGEVQTIAASTAAKGNITGINTLLNYNTGSGTEPSVGDTVTGGTSGATGTIAEVIIDSGSFAGNDAAGTMEITPVTRTFEAEALAWTASTATVASVNPNCVLVTSFAATYGAKNDADNGDTYYAWSSIQRSPKPYVASQSVAASFMSSTTPTAIAKDIIGTRYVKAMASLIKKATIIDPMTANKSFSHEDQVQVESGQIFILDPDADNRSIGVWATAPTIEDGTVIDIININTGSNRVRFFQTGTFIAPGERGTFVYQDAAWHVVSLTQDLRSIDSPTFAGLSLLDTSPELLLHNTTEEDADDGRESTVRFKGEQSGGELTTLAMIRGSHDGAADDEKGKLEVLINDTNDGDTPTLRLSIDSEGNTQIVGDLVANTYNFAADAEASDTYVITLDPAPAAYVNGMTIRFTANTANTGACTVNVNALGAKSLKVLHDRDPGNGYIESGSVVVAEYDGTNFQMIQPDASKPDYAGILADDNAVATTILLVDAYEPILIWDTNMPEIISNGDFTSNNITIGNDGDYEIRLHVNAESSGTGKTIEVDVFEIAASGDSITAGGVTQANPGVVNSTGHSFNDGDRVKISGVAGMTELNGQIYTVAGAGANDFQLNDDNGANINTTGYGAYTSGGTVFLASCVDVAHSHRKFGAGAGDVGSMSGGGIATLTGGDTLEVHIKNITDATNMTTESVQLSIIRL